VTLPRPVVFWSAALAALLVFLFVFSDILLPFVAGMALAYALDPIADWFERLGMNRLGATLTILALMVLFVALVLVVLVPVLARQFADFIEGVPGYVEKLQSLTSSALHSRLSDYLGINLSDLGSSLAGVSSEAAGWLATLVSSLWSGGRAVVNIMSLLVITPIVAFYLLYDWDRLVEQVDSLLPRDHVEEIRQIAGDIDQAIAAFVRGQGLVSLIMAVFYSSGLVLVGLNFGFLIGLVAGLLGFIPFVGALIGFVVSLGVALVQFWPDWLMIVATLSVFVFGQMLENYFLQPRLIGHNVGLHPVWVMFALLAFGYLFGFVGVLLAIPAAAAVGVLVRYGLKRYRDSPIYRGGSSSES
jgi:predicted PurR-regulated permease PerM